MPTYHLKIRYYLYDHPLAFNVGEWARLGLLSIIIITVVATVNNNASFLKDLRAQVATRSTDYQLFPWLLFIYY